MLNDHEHYHKPKKKIKWWQTNTGMLLIVLAAVGGYFIIKEHRVHLAENWFLLLLLLCPLMHIFMHGHHGDHKQGHENKDREEK